MFSKNLKEARKSKGWNQKDLAERSGVSFEQISRYETGKSRPQRSVVRNLANALGVTPNNLEGASESEALDIDQIQWPSNEQFNKLINDLRSANFTQKEKRQIAEYIELILFRNSLTNIVKGQ